LTVSIDGEKRYTWLASTGMAGYATPTDPFEPSCLLNDHHSRRWGNALMPRSISFTDIGHVIPRSRATGRLGSTRFETNGADLIGTGLPDECEAGRDHSRLTSFDPLTTG
jgi:hypothetical protein